MTVTENGENNFSRLLDSLQGLPAGSRRWALFLATSLCSPFDLVNASSEVTQDGGLLVAERRVPLSLSAQALLFGEASGRRLWNGRLPAASLAELNLDAADLADEALCDSVGVWMTAIEAVTELIPSDRRATLEYAGVLPPQLPIARMKVVTDAIDAAVARAGYTFT